MKEWVQVPFDCSDKWEEYAKSALKYVNGKSLLLTLAINNEGFG